MAVGGAKKVLDGLAHFGMPRPWKVSPIYPTPIPIQTQPLKSSWNFSCDCSVLLAVNVGGGIMAEMVGALEWWLGRFGAMIGFIMGWLLAYRPRG